ncbi:hypothetical protein B0A48_00392 [Cryoendolithus antarcticus]|uniref:DUF7165 domain-containing protein n=1 Tax=Cryoendolithus antarcticus TaxID=1507870 RepID=A0A1V8TUD7_9PEZI|nr:hypothetical protein B0A48_00392 [Cryoendolithus antarcticus]
MPVSTFSSDTCAVRAGAGRSNILERWSSTRERILEDERRQSVSEIVEMDGTGLHERSDWPMREASPPAIEKKLTNGYVEPARNGDWKEGNHHITDVTAGELPDGDWEADDVSEETDVESSSGGQEIRDSLFTNGSTKQKSRYNVEEVVTPEEHPTETHLEQRRGEVSLRESEHSRPSPAEVAPAPAIAAPAGLAAEDLAANAEIQDRSGPADRRHEERSTSSVGSHSTEFETYDPGEERDLATPIPSQWQGATPEQEQREWSGSGSPRTSPQTNGRATPTSYHARQSSSQTTPTDGNAHARQNSMMKGTPPSTHSRRSSTYNPYNTTQIPFNKDRVRYSWQSMADDEPNRPRIHIIKLISNTATASAGFPQGEAFGFSLSSGGRRIAAYNSARLFVLQTAALPVGISQDYALKRRPLAVEIVDDGNTLAILADSHTVNIYDLSHHRLRRSRTVKLDFPTSTIALAPMGGLLAVAYEGGVEVFSLSSNALPTDRRAVRSQKMDKLSFSADGSTLLGTTTRINVSSTVVINVPVFASSPHDVPTHDELKEAWCSDLLHPENIRNSSHAVFMRENRTTCNERLYAWNGVADTFGILNTTDMEYGNIDFPVVISPPLSTCGGLGAAIHSCPAIDEHGDTIAMIVNDRTIRLYIIPHKAEEGETVVEAHSIDHELDEGYGCPFSEVKWVYSHASLPAPLSNQTQVQGRLIVTSPGGVVEMDQFGEESVQDIEGGRIILFDFDPQFTGQPGQTFSLTLGKSPPQTLEEAEFDVADEVALVRRRTVNQSKGGGLSQRPVTLGRAALSSASSRGGSRSNAPGSQQPRRPGSVLSLRSDAGQSLPDLPENGEAGESLAGETFEEPFQNGAPRSQASLQRAASNAQRHRFQTLEERTQARVSSDSNGGFLPLPEYTEEPNAPLPSRFRAMAGLDAPLQAQPRPAIITRPNGNERNVPGAVPMTAPPAVGELFSADRAFAAAMAAFPRAQPGVQAAPVPRNLQRAYSNAVPLAGAGPAPSLIGDWENVRPVAADVNGHVPTPTSPSNSSLMTPVQQVRPLSFLQDSEQTPISPASTIRPPSAPTQDISPPPQQNRYSASLLPPPGSSQPNNGIPPGPTRPAQPNHQQNNPFAIPHSLPPHVAAFRSAALAQHNSQSQSQRGAHSHSASLFPASQSSNQIPHRSPPPQPGSVGHPITAWHPPAPSGHVRSGSGGQRSAVTSLGRGTGRKKSVFRRRKKDGGFGDGGGLDGDDGKSMAGRSVRTWVTGRTGRLGRKGDGEKGCVVM